MTIEIFKPNRERTLNRALTLWLCRLASVALFGLGLFYWVRLVGVFDGPLWRFDLMPVPWRIAAPVLAVLCPIAGVGLWMAVSWGAVVWIIVAIAEAVMAFGFPAVFGGDLTIVTVHGAGLGLLAALRLAAWFGGRRAAKV